MNVRKKGESPIPVLHSLPFAHVQLIERSLGVSWLTLPSLAADIFGNVYVGASVSQNVFRIDAETGGLIFTGKTVNCPTPICIEF